MERRHFTRIHFNSEVNVRQGQQTLSCQLDDVSLKGVLLSSDTAKALDPNEPVLLVIELINGERIMIEGIIRHYEPPQVGIEITLMDIDSASRLKRLVELNMGDDTLLKRELNALLGDAQESPDD